MSSYRNYELVTYNSQLKSIGERITSHSGGRVLARSIDNRSIDIEAYKRSGRKITISSDLKSSQPIIIFKLSGTKVRVIQHYSHLAETQAARFLTIPYLCHIMRPKIQFVNVLQICKSLGFHSYSARTGTIIYCESEEDVLLLSNVFKDLNLSVYK